MPGQRSAGASGEDFMQTLEASYAAALTAAHSSYSEIQNAKTHQSESTDAVGKPEALAMPRPERNLEFHQPRLASAKPDGV